MKKHITIILCAALLALMLVGCAANPWTEITATTIQDSIRTGSITQTIQGYKPARIDFTIHGFGETPPVEDAGDVKQVTAWFVDYAHFYQNGEELERSYYYYNEDEFIKGRQCVITVFYQVPDEGAYSGLSFSFDLEGFEASYSGDFDYKANQ